MEEFDKNVQDGRRITYKITGFIQNDIKISIQQDTQKEKRILGIYINRKEWGILV